MTKINLKFYFALTLFSTVLASLFNVKDLNYLIGVWIFYLGTLLNHYFLIKGLSFLLNAQSHFKNDSRRNFKMLFYLIGKVLILGASLTICVHFVGDRIIIPLINYVIQIFVLVFSSRKNLV